MKVKLAEALLRRKELMSKVDQLRKINIENLFVTHVTRKLVNENTDDITTKVPKITLAQVAAGFDWYAKQLRLVDAAIQQANWTVEIEVGPDAMKDYVETEPETK